MKEESSLLSVPYQFARCFNAQCTQSEKCLRRQAALRDATNYPTITIINPNCIPADGVDCPHFKSVQKVRVAWGVKRLIDKIPYEDALSIRNQLVGHFGKSRFYRFYREENGLMPKDQAYIRQLFHKKGYTEEPDFGHYTDEYIW